MPISEDRLHEDTTSVRNEELRTIWIANGFWILIHGYGMSFVVENVKHPIAIAALCLIGFIFGTFWLQSTDKMWGWLGVWNIGSIQQQSTLPEEQRVFGGKVYEEESRRGVSIRTTIQSMIWMFIFGWYVIAMLGVFGLTQTTGG